MANSFHLVLVAVRLTGGPWFRNSSKGWGEVKSPHWGGNQKCCWRDFFIGWWVPEEDWFWWFEPFSKLKPAFCEQWASVKIKTSMTCVHKEYEVKTKWCRKIFLIGIHSMQGWAATTMHGVTRKRSTKRLEHTGNLFRKNLHLKDVC